jgi:polar amino acid transport system substrate-binding protein
MKRKILAVSLAICMLITVLVGCTGSTTKSGLDNLKDKGKVIMLTNAGFPPFEYLGDDNKPAGVDIDVASEIAKDLGVTLEIV